MLLLLHNMVPLNDGNCHLSMLVVKGRWSRDVIPHTFNIGMFKSFENKSTTIKNVFDESANIIEGCNVAFDTFDCWNFPGTMSVIGIESMVTCTCLHYTQDYLMLGICSLIKPDAMENWCHFLPKSTQSCYNLVLTILMLRLEYSGIKRSLP